MSYEKKLQELGLELPAAPKPVGSYLPAVRTGHLVYTAGQLPIRGGTPVATGKVGAEVPLEVAQQCARQAVLNALAALRSLVGSLDAVTKIVRLNVFVNSAAGFVEQAKVANGASDLLVSVFGDAGRHTRCALGVAELPLNVPVELDIIAEIQ